MSSQARDSFRSICPECGASYAGDETACAVDGASLLAPDDDRVGQLVDRYVLVRRIGRGAMGTVYLGVHESIGSRVAIKVIERAADEDSPELARVVREARAVNRIRHPNIVRIHDMDRLDDGRPYITMEYLEGESLASRMGRLPPIAVDDAERWVTQILSALEAAHGAGYVHRDLKPDNIFLTSEGDTRLLDFGIAKLLEDGGTLTADGAVVGTPIYLSPEQAKGTLSDVGPAADLYSIGVILYELFTGRPPFDHRNLTQLLVAHVTETPPSPSSLEPGVTPGLERLLLDCLAKRPDDRVRSAADLAHRFETALAEYRAVNGAAHLPAPDRPERAEAGGPTRRHEQGGSQPRGPASSRARRASEGDTFASGDTAAATPPASAPAAGVAGSAAGSTGGGEARGRPWRVALAAAAGVVGLAALSAVAWRSPPASPDDGPAAPTEAVAPGGGGTDRAAPAPSGTLAVALPGRPDTLDPAETSLADTSRVLHQVYEPLVRLDPLTLDPQPRLATSWRKEGDTWYFTLRPGVRFHDGRPLDGETAAAAMRATVGGRLSVERIAVTGPMEIGLTSHLGSNVFFAQLAGPAGLVALVREGTFPVGTGPFRVESAKLDLGLIVLEANGDYWGEPPHVARVVFRATADEDLRVDQLRSGESQLAVALLAATARRLGEVGELGVIRSRENATAFLALNCRHPLLQDPRARAALALAIDHRRIAERVYEATPAAGLVPPALGGRPSLSERRHDPAEARATLARLGLAGETLPALFVSEHSSWNPAPEVAAELLREDLAAVGVGLDAELLPLDDLDRARRDSHHALVLMAWLPDYPDPTTFYYLLTESWERTSGEMGYVSDAFEGAYAQALRATDPRERGAAFAAMDALVNEDRPLIPLAYVAEYHAHVPSVRNLGFGFGTLFDLSDARLAP